MCGGGESSSGSASASDNSFNNTYGDWGFDGDDGSAGSSGSSNSSPNNVDSHSTEFNTTAPNQYTSPEGVTGRSGEEDGGPSAGASGRGGEGGVNASPSANGVNAGGLGPGGLSAADSSYNSIGPAAWNAANNNFGTGLNGAAAPTGVMSDIADWASRMGLFAQPGAGQEGMFDAVPGLVGKYAPAAISLFNPMLGLATQLGLNAYNGELANSAPGVVGALASYFGGPVAGTVGQMAAQAYNGNTNAAATTGLAGGINNAFGINGLAAQAVSGLVGQGVNAMGNTTADSYGAPGTSNGVTSAPGGDERAYNTSGSEMNGNPNDPATYYGGPDSSRGNNPNASTSGVSPSDPNFLNKLVNSLTATGTKALDYAANNPLSVANGALQLYANYQKQQAANKAASGAGTPQNAIDQMAALRANPQFRSFDIATTPRNRVTYQGDLTKYGQAGQGGGHQFFDVVNPTVTAVARNYAAGGPVQGVLNTMARTPHGLVAGTGGGQDDLVGARLSPNEYVMDADTMASLGDGNPVEGARRLDIARQNLRKHKRSAPITAIPPKAKPPAAYLPGGRK